MSLRNMSLHMSFTCDVCVWVFNTTFQQYFIYIVVVSFNGEEYWINREKTSKFLLAVDNLYHKKFHNVQLTTGGIHFVNNL